MIDRICAHRLEGLKQVVLHHRVLMITLCVFNIINSFVATFGNLIVIHALWKSTSMTSNLRKFFLSLAFSDLAVGLFAQLTYGIIIAVMLKIAANDNYNFGHLCPTIVNLCYFSAHFLACASCLNITTIAVDRLLAVSLHLRYQEIVTSKRVTVILVSLWTVSAVISALYISLPDLNSLVTVAIECTGLLVTAVAYIRIYQVVRYHLNQIERQLQLQYHEAVDFFRERRSAINAFFVFVVFIACYIPNFCTAMLLIYNSSRVCYLAAYHVTSFLILLNSSLNPLIYCWRYREIREVVKSTVKKIFNVSDIREVRWSQRETLSYMRRWRKVG